MNIHNTQSQKNMIGAESLTDITNKKYDRSHFNETEFGDSSIVEIKNTLKDYNVNKINALSSHHDTNRAFLNVGGYKHEVLWKTLERFPHTRLGRLKNAKTINEVLQLCDNYSQTMNEYFFDRHPRSFLSILNFYRTGELHLIENVCVLAFQEDLKYWGIKEFYLEMCCYTKYQHKKEVLLEELRQWNLKDDERVDEFKGCFPLLRSKIWDLMENPQTSIFARVS